MKLICKIIYTYTSNISIGLIILNKRFLGKVLENFINLLVISLTELKLMIDPGNIHLIDAFLQLLMAKLSNKFFVAE